MNFKTQLKSYYRIRSIFNEGASKCLVQQVSTCDRVTALRRRTLLSLIFGDGRSVLLETSWQQLTSNAVWK
jgi:hypothetical protein